MIKLTSTSIGLVALLTIPASSLTISIDYSDSTSAFFDGSPNGILARAAVQAAADDISAVITTSLNALSSQRSFTGTFGITNVTLDHTLGYTNPDTGLASTYMGGLAADEFKIFVGARALSGFTLGQGGPGSFTFGGSADGLLSEGQAASDIASADSTAAMSRGAAAPEINTLVGQFSGTSITVSTTYGPTLGNLWFDNDGTSDWHFAHTTPVEAGKIDLYSVALHEILHSVGIGLYASWINNVSGTDWTGAEAIALHGTGIGLISVGGDHIADNTFSFRLSDGGLQEVVMDPNITSGVRKTLTQLDVAFLRDLGWQTIPEPSSTILLELGSLTFIIRRRR